MAPDYTNFQTEDFVLDDSFQAYAAGSDALAVKFWQDWLTSHPIQQPVAEQARQLIIALGQAQQPAVPAEQLEADLQRLHRAIRRPLAQPKLWVQVRRFRVAISLVLLAALGAGFWWWPSYGLSPVRYRTVAGQQRTVHLPDGSVVVLNGNSNLTTTARWAPNAPREVWLEGEAFFQVRHLSRVAHLPVAQATGYDRFVVHAGALNVTVLGTTFNVLNRSETLSQVTLNSGQVLVAHPTLFSHEEALLAPNEQVNYSPAHHHLEKRPVLAANYSTWVHGTLKFDHTPLANILQLLHDTYGLTVTVDDPVLLRQTVTGSLPSQNANVLLQALAESLGMRTQRSGNSVRLLPLR